MRVPAETEIRAQPENYGCSGVGRNNNIVLDSLLQVQAEPDDDDDDGGSTTVRVVLQDATQKENFTNGCTREDVVQLNAITHWYSFAREVLLLYAFEFELPLDNRIASKAAY
ncbi:hypothetical protein TKK_0013156 [Trichogramma kaykai]|uniref:Uncharacterized protein n=1 Tax=Trichogramma kaykai TaxID=54128 RepID=A0ABD2WJP4_9HYME